MSPTEFLPLFGSLDGAIASNELDTFGLQFGQSTFIGKDHSFDGILHGQLLVHENIALTLVFETVKLILKWKELE